MIIVDSIAHKCMPVSRTLKPGGKIAALCRRRFPQQHYTRADLQDEGKKEEQQLSEKPVRVGVRDRVWGLDLGLTSALSKPLQVASPDCASLYSASLELRVPGRPARVNGGYKKLRHAAPAVHPAADNGKERKDLPYPSARFSRKQNNDNAPHWKWHDDARQGPPNSASCHPSRSPGRSIPRLQETNKGNIKFTDSRIPCKRDILQSGLHTSMQTDIPFHKHFQSLQGIK